MFSLTPAFNISTAFFYPRPHDEQARAALEDEIIVLIRKAKLIGVSLDMDKYSICIHFEDVSAQKGFYRACETLSDHSLNNIFSHPQGRYIKIGPSTNVGVSAVTPVAYNTH